jgi:hypothetical protein
LEAKNSKIQGGKAKKKAMQCRNPKNWAGGLDVFSGFDLLLFWCAYTLGACLYFISG